MLPWNFVQVDISLIAGKQHEENINKGLSAWQAVGIMKSMPDKIQCINGKLPEEEHCTMTEGQSRAVLLFLYTNKYGRVLIFRKDMHCFR